MGFFFTGDRGIESTSLQRRVHCEPDFRSGAVSTRKLVPSASMQRSTAASFRWWNRAEGLIPLLLSRSNWTIRKAATDPDRDAAIRKKRDLSP